MAGVHRIFGSELSPYSVKVRSYFRYKRIPHEWIARSSANQEEFQRHAKLPLIPLVVTPDDRGYQDSTPIIEAMEYQNPEPALDPADAALAFLSALLEEYADEWGNKPMFHYRWTYEADQRFAAETIARQMMPGIEGDQLDGAVGMVKGRMIPRLKLVGSSPETLPAIEGSYRRQLRVLEPHLTKRRYLFGGRPCLADFGLFGQFYELGTDPTPKAILGREAPHVAAWIERMLEPAADGPFEEWSSLELGLAPLLRDEVAGVFLPWSDANAKAIAAGEKSFSLEIGGRPFAQETQKYHAKSLAALRARYARVTDRSRLDPVLESTGCLRWLRG